MKWSSFGVLHIYYCAGRGLVHTRLHNGHQLVRIQGPGLLNGRRKRVDNNGVSIRGVGRRLAESFHIAVNKGLCEFIVLNPTGIGIHGHYIIAHPLGGLPEGILLGLHIDADLYSRDLEFACLSGKRNPDRGGKDGENDMGP